MHTLLAENFRRGSGGAFQSYYNTVVFHSPCEFAQDRQLLNESRVDSQHPNRFVRIFDSAFQAVMISGDSSSQTLKDFKFLLLSLF